MPVEFENIITNRIITSLEYILVEEFSIPVYLSEHKGNQSFLLLPNNDNLVDYGQNFQSRDYSIDIEYRLTIGGTFTRNTFKQASNIAERVKKIITNNSAYSLDGDYKWQDGKVESIEYVKDDDDDSTYLVRITFNCTSMEVC